MKRLIPFVFTTIAVVLSIAIVTAYRTGMLAKVAGPDWRERFARRGAAAPEEE